MRKTKKLSDKKIVIELTPDFAKDEDFANILAMALLANARAMDINKKLNIFMFSALKKGNLNDKG